MSKTEQCKQGKECNQGYILVPTMALAHISTLVEECSDTLKEFQEDYDIANFDCCIDEVRDNCKKIRAAINKIITGK